ncbi:hypothetical protein Tco_1215987 [Tanacetum coccineum]
MLYPRVLNLSCRGMDMMNSINVAKSVMLSGTTKSTCFFQCELVRQIMRKISIWWNVDYADVSSYEEWLAWLVSIRIQIKLKGMMEGVFYGLWWSIWNFRNKILFEDKPPKKALLFDNLHIDLPVKLMSNYFNTTDVGDNGREYKRLLPENTYLDHSTYLAEVPLKIASFPIFSRSLSALNKTVRPPS